MRATFWGMRTLEWAMQLRLTEPTTAAWYRKSMLLAKDLTPPSQAEHQIVDLEHIDLSMRGRELSSAR